MNSERSTLVDDLVRRAEFGRPRSIGALTLVPLYGAIALPAYRTAGDALSAGDLTIGEVGNGNVPELMVSNRAPLPVLIVEGEHLQGARQNRILNSSVLVDAGADTVIPVSCVERGRWAYGGRSKASLGLDMAYPALRAMKHQQVGQSVRTSATRRSDQAAIWTEIERKRSSLSAGASPTGAMGDAFDHRRVDLEALLGSFPEPLRNQCGVMAFGGRHPLAVDIFDRPSTLRSLWPRLIRGYALDALTARRSRPEPFSIRGFLAALFDPNAMVTSHPGIGLGEDVVVTSQIVTAMALTWSGGVVHLAAFPVRGGRTATRTWFRA